MKNQTEIENFFQGIDIFQQKQVKLSCKEKFKQYITSKYYVLFMWSVAVIALTQSEIKVIFFSPKYDIYFDILTVIIHTIFVIDIILSFTFNKNYRCSFFNIFDIISTTVLIFTFWLGFFENQGLLKANFIQYLQQSKIAKTLRAGKFGKLVQNKNQLIHNQKVRNKYSKKNKQQDIQKSILENIILNLNSIRQDQKEKINIKSSSEKKYSQNYTPVSSINDENVNQSQLNQSDLSAYQDKQKKKLTRFIDENRVDITYQQIKNFSATLNTQIKDQDKKQEILKSEELQGQQYSNIVVQNIIIIVILIIFSITFFNIGNFIGNYRTDVFYFDQLELILQQYPATDKNFENYWNQIIEFQNDKLWYAHFKWKQGNEEVILNQGSPQYIIGLRKNKFTKILKEKKLSSSQNYYYFLEVHLNKIVETNLTQIFIMISYFSMFVLFYISAKIFTQSINSIIINPIMQKMNTLDKTQEGLRREIEIINVYQHLQKKLFEKQQVENEELRNCYNNVIGLVKLLYGSNHKQIINYVQKGEEIQDQVMHISKKRIIACIRLNLNGKFYKLDFQKTQEHSLVRKFYYIIHLNAIKFKGEILEKDCQFVYIGWQIQENDNINDQYLYFLCILNIFIELHREECFNKFKKKNEYLISIVVIQDQSQYWLTNNPFAQKELFYSKCLQQAKNISYNKIAKFYPILIHNKVQCINRINQFYFLPVVILDDQNKESFNVIPIYKKIENYFKISQKEEDIQNLNFYVYDKRFRHQFNEYSLRKYIDKNFYYRIIINARYVEQKKQIYKQIHDLIQNENIEQGILLLEKENDEKLKNVYSFIKQIQIKKQQN